LKFSVQRVVDVHSWAIEGEGLIDLRKGTKFRSGELERVATAELLPAWQSGQGAEAATAIEKFAQEHSKDIRKQSRVDPNEDLAAYREWERSVGKWMFGAEHVRLAYSLEYGNLKIERLSPGSRGIVLLLLYLAVDKEETDPLIIDQPEENLDPESVYSELVGLFRDASTRRQVIMVTHNPNLVVNTDVDQV
jgi:ATPase subunit of ABC transporter with duplicated ATPase domains